MGVVKIISIEAPDQVVGIPGQEELGTADSLRRVGPSLLLSPVV